MHLNLPEERGKNCILLSKKEQMSEKVSRAGSLVIMCFIKDWFHQSTRMEQL